MNQTVPSLKPVKQLTDRLLRRKIIVLQISLTSNHCNQTFI